MKSLILESRAAYNHEDQAQKCWANASYVMSLPEQHSEPIHPEWRCERRDTWFPMELHWSADSPFSFFSAESRKRHQNIVPIEKISMLSSFGI